MKIKGFDLAVILSFFLCAIVGVLRFENTCEEIRGDVLRLHVIAHSDSDIEQKLKLKVRDAVLNERGDIFSDTDDIALAKRKIEANLDDIRDIAKTTIEKEGFDYDVKVSLEKSFFTTRAYSDSITMPAGYYDALKIVIGQGQGKNWWCVMFPPMCLSAASQQTEVLSDVLTKQEMKVVTASPKYEVRFWIVEKYWELVEKARGR